MVHFNLGNQQWALQERSSALDLLARNNDLSDGLWRGNAQGVWPGHAQSLLGGRRFEEAAAEAAAALELLGEWGTAWDKRLSWEAWIAWARVLLKGARERAWPETAFGIISLGEVRPGA